MKLFTAFQRQSGIVKVLLSTLLIVIFILVYAVFYYGRINSAADPRVREANELLLQYEKGIESDQYGMALSILKAMDLIYRNTEGYEHSFERGVVLNNKASVHLVKLETDLLNEVKVNRITMLETLDIAETYTRQAIGLYEQWLSDMGKLTRDEVEQRVRPTFTLGDPALEDVNVENVIQKRVDDIMLAQLETKRRLSVTYTNLGVIERYKGNLEISKKCYEKAIELWDRNYTAKDNLNVLLNQPVNKRSMIDRMFPPERAAELNQ